MTGVTAPKRVVVTGEGADATDPEPTADSTPKLRWPDRPLLVYVCDDSGTCAESEKFEEIVLSDERVALGVRAFRCVKMNPDQVAEDEILADHGKSVPRVLVVDPAKLRVKVLETKDLKASKLYRTMKSASGKFWKQKLDKVVKEHLKLLTAIDRLANVDKTLADQETRASDDAKKLGKIKAERKEIGGQIAELAKQQTALWKLTPKSA